MQEKEWLSKKRAAVGPVIIHTDSKLPYAFTPSSGSLSPNALSRMSTLKGIWKMSSSLRFDCMSLLVVQPWPAIVLKERLGFYRLFV